ncbi:putative two pore potassium channel protein sup-9-like [Apostichopus japonicus]|uniref:Putative two pore potassium channel protein sup-9-like n=1 Tax=Stichopus japonicus TaxID=307972 RepID=A0A2G8JBT2_STIJA|nr:putative two pore potassium channel protein sup-9-like [Apostichopus japonicus]
MGFVSYLSLILSFPYFLAFSTGYGHSTPRTDGGKIFCMIYSLIGIPLNLVMFQSVGERLNILMGFGIKKIKRCLKFKKAEVSHTELVMIGALTTGFITITGSLAFSKFENWSFLDAYYFVSITLTTIGFGDLVVLQKNNHLQNSPQYVFFSIMYILGALVVVASVMNLLVLRLLTLNTEDERREQQEQAMRQSAVELNHIDSHIAFHSNHNHSSGPLLGGKISKIAPPSMIRMNRVIYLDRTMSIFLYTDKVFITRSTQI